MKLKNMQDIESEFFFLLLDFGKYDNNKIHANKIIEAYQFAKQAHAGITRKSGEPYLMHPVEVAKIAVLYKCDWITVITALLHDIVEDTKISLQEIAKIFGHDVAVNVNAVTKMTKMDFKQDISKIELEIKTIRKLFQTMIYQDIRGVAIKLFDRLHNMRTMQHMPFEKQISKAKETLEVYVPLAEALGANQIKKELQDLSLLYLDQEMYKSISAEIEEITAKYKTDLEQAQEKIHTNLLAHGLNNEINLRIKNIFNVYISLSKVYNLINKQDFKIGLDNIHDLYALQIGLSNTPQCFLSLGIINEIYPTYFQNKMKDYINVCKTTGYRALHTTFVTENQRMIQAQIRTHEMAWKNTKGIIGNLKDYNFNEFKKIKEQYPFFSICEEIDKTTLNDHDFYDTILYEILGDKIFVDSAKTGNRIQLPVGATVLDYGFFACPGRIVKAKDGLVNGEIVDLNYPLKNGDVVTFTNEEMVTVNYDWLDKVKTTKSRRLINENLKKRG